MLEPGMTVRKARLMMELHLPLLMLAQLGLQQGADQVRGELSLSPSSVSHFVFQALMKKDFQKGLITLKLALKVHKY